MNGFLTAGRKKNGEVEDELDRSLEGMDHSDDQFDKGTSITCLILGNLSNNDGDGYKNVT